MRDKDDIILENLYSTIISETRNTKFLKELDPLLKKWNDIQSNIKGTIPTFGHDPDGNPYDAPDAGQQIDKKDLPVYFQNTKIDKDKTIHPSLRRVYHAQTYDEVQIEKELLRIYQKYADQEYFNRDVVFIHDFDYNAAAQYWGNKEGTSTRNETLIGYLENENKIHKDVLSCHGVDVTRYHLNNTGTYGLMVKGRVLYASRGDLASQTFRTLPKAAREFFKHSGVPKRTSVEKIHSFEEDNPYLSMRKKIKARKGEEMSQEDISDFLNSTILDKNDSPYIEEALLGNWKIDGWFFCEFKDGLPYPNEFWKKAYENNIQKPVYFIELNTQNKPQKVDLKDYFSDTK